MKSRRQSITLSEFIAVAIVYLFIIKLSGAIAAWSEPSSAPPLGSIPVAINAGNKIQEKVGSLELGGNLQTNGRSSLTGTVGINTNPPSSADAAIDVAGTARADLFCFRDPVTGDPSGKCLSFSGQGIFNGVTGGAGSQGAAGAAGIPGLAGHAGAVGLAGANAFVSFVQSIASGAGIIFRDSSGNIISSIGGGSTSGSIQRNFTANPCTGSGIYLNAIDPNGATTCVNIGSPSGGPTGPGILSISSTDNPYSINVVRESKNAIDISVNDYSIQRVLSRGCGQGMAIGRIYSDGEIECTPAAGYCGISGRTFFCVDSSDNTTSIAIP